MTFKTVIDEKYYQWVYIAKGFGICSVVISHFDPQLSPAYWLSIRSIISSFHMPLFFILAGYLYQHNKYSYHNLIVHKIERLLYPFVTIAASFFIIKYIAGQLIHLNYPVNIKSIYNLLIDPINSYMPLLWFIQTLFLIFVVYPPLRIIFNNLILLILLFSIRVFIKFDFPVLENIIHNIPFFIFGVILKENKSLSNIAIANNYFHWISFLFLFSLMYAIKVSLPFNIELKELLSIILGLLGALFIINLSHFIFTYANKKITDIFIKLGFFSMTIYLLHTLFESTIRVTFSQIFNHIKIPFELVAFVAVTSGIIFPIIIEKVFLRKYRITRKLVLGITEPSNLSDKH